MPVKKLRVPVQFQGLSELFCFNYSWIIRQEPAKKI